jgi:PIF1-like helicase/Helix-turn-helix domain
MGYNVFLTGAAGSGKTYLVNRFIRHCHDHGISIAITASTGIAATHIGGMTIHSWSGMGIRDNLTSEDIEYIMEREYLMKRYAKTSVLIIDEISMLGGNFLASLDILLQRARVSPEPFGGMQVVLVGDFFQLPPVSKGSSRVEFAFEHPSWRTLKLAICTLTTQYRQGREMRDEKWEMSDDASEDPLLSILNEIRSGEVSSRSRTLLDARNIRVETEDHTELFTRNISVDAYNKDKLDSIAWEISIYAMHAKWAEKLVESLKKWCLAPESLVLKVGARVMFVKNGFEAGYANGSIGHITGHYEWLPIVELIDGTRIIADYVSWAVEENGRVKAEITQIPLRLAWAITVHKSQGMTLDSAVMDLTDAFVPGQGYVALSRVRSLEWLILRGYNSTALEIDPRVIDYDRVLRATSLAIVDKIALMTERDKDEKKKSAIITLGWVLEKVSSLPKWSKKTATHLETYEYLRAGKSLDEIAELRGLKASTIFSHLEKILESGKELDITPYRPTDEERLHTIHQAFITIGSYSLSSAREYLADNTDEEFDYDELRIARLFLSATEQRKIEEATLYESEGIEMN